MLRIGILNLPGTKTDKKAAPRQPEHHAGGITAATIVQIVERMTSERHIGEKIFPYNCSQFFNSPLQS